MNKRQVIIEAKILTIIIQTITARTRMLLPLPLYDLPTYPHLSQQCRPLSPRGPNAMSAAL